MTNMVNNMLARRRRGVCPAQGERGFTLVEMLVAMLMTTIMMGSVVYLFTSFIDDNRYDAFRDDAQANAQVMIDRMSRDIRSAASPSAGSSGLLAKAGSYDIAFEAVNATPGTAPSGNPANQMWVRYCLDSNNTLWRQTTTPSSTTSSLPNTSSCPSTSNAWVQESGGTPCCQELNDVTNEIGGDTTRPLFTYGPSGESSLSQINSVEVNMWVDKNPGHLPGDTELTSGIYLRNELGAPTAQFSPVYTIGTNTTDVTLNGSASSDPNGQALTFQWYEGAGTSLSCPNPPTSAPSSGQISGATTQVYDAGSFTNGTQETFALVVTNTGGLSYCQAQTVTIP